MKNFPQIVNTATKLTLLGGGSVEKSDLSAAMEVAPVVLAADGGANQAMDWGVKPDAVIGDLDSVDRSKAEDLGVPLVYVEDQNSTDLQKCLVATTSPIVLGVGFLGGRLDHQLAAMTAVSGCVDRCLVLIGEEDVVFRLPDLFRMEMSEGTRVSVFPMSSCVARSMGLEWALDGLSFQPNGQIGCSNRATGGDVRVEIVSGDMLMILPKGLLSDALAALCTALRISRQAG